jgi:hypothetical protein
MLKATCQILLATSSIISCRPTPSVFVGQRKQDPEFYPEILIGG